MTVDLTIDDVRNNRENLCFTWHCGNVSPDGLACIRDPGHGGRCLGPHGIRWDGDCPASARRAHLHGSLAHYCMLTTSDMAASFKISPSTVRRHMKALEAGGLVAYNAEWRMWEALDGERVVMRVELEAP